MANILWGSGRGMHLSVGMSAGKGMLEVMLLYGMQGRGQRNVALLEAALWYSAQVRNLPKVVLGDFNKDLHRVQGLPHLMTPWTNCVQFAEEAPAAVGTTPRQGGRRG